MEKGRVNVIVGNAISVALATPQAAFLHVVNCKGVMGSGVAKEVKERVTEAYEVYAYAAAMGIRLGSYSTSAGFYNLAAQEDFGRQRRHLNYAALAHSLSSVRQDTLAYNTIVVPYKMGADRAGGDWDIVVEMLEFFFADKFIIACKLGVK